MPGPSSVTRSDTQSGPAVPCEAGVVPTATRRRPPATPRAPARRHGLDPVHRHVRDDLLELRLVATDEDRLLGKHEIDPHLLLLGQRPEHGERARYHPAEVDEPHRRSLASSIVEE